MSVGDDAVRLARLERDCAEGADEEIQIMAIHFSHGPAEGSPTVRQRLQADGALRLVSLLQPVAAPARIT